MATTYARSRIISWVVTLVAAAGASAQLPGLDLPHGLTAATDDPRLAGSSAIIVSIAADEAIYIGKDAVPKNEFGPRFGRSLKDRADANTIVYLAVSSAVDYQTVVEALNTIRQQRIEKIGLIVKRGAPGDSSLGIFQVFVPALRDPGEDVSKLTPNPLTLVAAINPKLELRLNSETGGRRGQLCFQAVPNGLDSDPSRLKSWLECLFNYRTQQHAYRIGFETRTDLPLSQRIEKTVFVKAPPSIKYIDVLRVINAVKAAGADPIGLQLDDLLYWPW